MNFNKTEMLSTNSTIWETTSIYLLCPIIDGTSYFVDSFFNVKTRDIS